jgi:hypothetical protein
MMLQAVLGGMREPQAGSTEGSVLGVSFKEVQRRLKQRPITLVFVKAP